MATMKRPKGFSFANPYGLKGADAAGYQSQGPGNMFDASPRNRRARELGGMIGIPPKDPLQGPGDIAASEQRRLRKRGSGSATPGTSQIMTRSLYVD